MKRCIAVLSLLILLSVGVTDALSIGAHDPLSQKFASVSKEAVPAVVSIRVVRPASKSNMSLFEERGFDFFGDDFFQQFFFPGRPSEKRPDIGQASGFLVTSDGYILTNSHVVKDAKEILVTLNDGETKEGKLIGQDPNTDIALVKIEGQNLPFLKLADSDQLETGEWLVAVGNPFGLQATVTVGIVSATGRNNLDLASVEDFIQTDAAINQGNSGGPLLNLDSQVVGINTAIVTNGIGGGYIGIGFAVPSNLAKHVMEQLLKDGSIQRGFLGVTLQELNQNLRAAFGLDRLDGALVADVAAKSPAELAGLKQGDIILSLNGRNIKNMGGLRTGIALLAPGTVVKIGILREGKEQEISVTLGTYPEKGDIVQKDGSPVSKLGIDVADITPEIAKKFRLKDDKGIIISKVDIESPAALAGLRPGVQILAVNNKPVNTTEDLLRIFEMIEKERPILFLVKDQDVVRFISFKIPS